MKIDDKVTMLRFKNCIRYYWALYILFPVLLIILFSAVEFYVNKPTDDEILSIWYDSAVGLNESTRNDIIALNDQYGIKENYWYSYSVNDTNYSTCFATAGVLNTDIFILYKNQDPDKQDTIDNYESSDLFKDLSDLNLDESYEYYLYEGKKIGVKYGDYYIFVRNGGSITNELAKAVIDVLVKK